MIPTDEIQSSVEDLPQRGQGRVVRIGPLAVDPDLYDAQIAGRPLHLSLRQFHVLHYLMSRPGRVATRRDLAAVCTRHDQDLTDRAIDNLVLRLRKKMGSHGFMIASVRGVGYRIEEAQKVLQSNLLE